MIVDTEKPTAVTPERVLSKCGWSPFEGQTFRSSIVSTLVNGQPVWHEGQIIEAGAAARLQFGSHASCDGDCKVRVIELSSELI